MSAININSQLLFFICAIIPYLATLAQATIC